MAGLHSTTLLNASYLAQEARKRIAAGDDNYDDAVLDALNGGGYKVHQIDFPITSEKVWQILRS